MDSFDETYSDLRKKKSDDKRKKKPKQDWLVAISAVQLVLAVLGVLLLFTVSKLSPVTFSSLKAEFESLMQKDISESKEVSLFAAGGEDEKYEATENVCFAPFDTTVKMIVPTQGRVTSRFGYRHHPITGKFGIHNGTDIAAPEGTPICAAFNGMVEEIGYNKVRGNYILVSHGGDTQTLYMHCSEVVAPEGAVVRQGEVIAKVGSTGYSTGPHLHFSILIGGKYCNPEWLIDDI